MTSAEIEALARSRAAKQSDLELLLIPPRAALNVAAAVALCSHIFYAAAMSEPVTELIGGEPYSYHPMGEYVVRSLEVCGGRPTFKHTRIEITGALARLASGESLDEIVAGYAGRVGREALLEASEIVRGRFDETSSNRAVQVL